MPDAETILDYLLRTLQELSADWDLPRPVTLDSLLFTELGFESLDAVILGTKIQEHYGRQMPFAELLAELGRAQRDLSVRELLEFIERHTGDGRPPGYRQ